MPENDDSALNTAHPTCIRRVEIQHLFGYLSYTISIQRRDSADFRRLMILYGDNGSGKTTILRLVFALLSRNLRRGDKSYISRTPFRRVTVLFDDGTSVTADKGDQLVGSYSVSIREPHQPERLYKLRADPSSNSITDQEPLTELLRALGRLSITLYFLPDDRRIRSTFMSEDGTDQGQVVHVSNLQRTLFANQLIYETKVGQFSSSGEFEEPQQLNINPVLAQTSTWFRRHAFQGSNTGEENATSIYLRVIQQIATLEGSTPVAEASPERTLGARLDKLRSRMDSFTRFGLIPPFPAERFLRIFVQANTLAKRTIATVLEPYVDGIEARLEALGQVRDLLTTYVETINSFLTHKSIEFTLQDGAAIRDFGGAFLDPDLLSSGEKQLILLLSNTILARDTASIFIIDEPELSLNIKWQRHLIDALLQCSQGSNIQYLLASHSVELITLHRANAIRLDSTEGTLVTHG